MDVNSINLSGMIDHTLLKPDATENDIKRLCEEARKYNFASVCVNPSYVPLAAELLKDTSVKVCTVVGFPLGATTTNSKVRETEEALSSGAEEIDMVINLGSLKSGYMDRVKKEIEAVVNTARGKGLVKVIIETPLLSDREKVEACTIAKEAGAAYVKTSTGFSKGGATVEDVRLMRDTVGPDMGVKASGGIRDYKTAIAMVKAGANRIGASASVHIIQGSL